MTSVTRSLGRGRATKSPGRTCGVRHRRPPGHEWPGYEIEEVLERATETLNIVLKGSRSLLDIALVFRLPSQRYPGPVGFFPEVPGEIFSTKIKKTEPLLQELGRRPGSSLGLITDVTGVVKVEIVFSQVRKKRFRPKMIELKIGFTRGKQLMQQAIGTAFREVLPDERR